MIVAHADWSVNAKKRWVAHATQRPDGAFVAQAVEPAGVPTLLIRRLLHTLPLSSAPNSLLLGLDLPIGLPSAYAAKTGVTHFRTLLPQLGVATPWRDFYDVAHSPDDITLYRPFYPARAGHSRQNHLVSGLGVSSMAALYRLCDRATSQRPAGAALFWTLGAQQVGKAAISGWSELIVPTLQDRDLRVRLWPFDGWWADIAAAADEVTAHTVVIAEAYPAEYYRTLALDFGGGSKRHAPTRRLVGQQLLAWADGANIAVATPLRDQIEDGFGDSAENEDPFDAVVGLFGMLNVVANGYPDAPRQLPPIVQTVEGWIFGQTALPA